MNEIIRTSVIPTNWADPSNPRFERSVAVVKVIKDACSQHLSVQQKVDETHLRLNAIDMWPKLKERLEKAREEARLLRIERLGLETA